jgi:hypothetical protein
MIVYTIRYKDGFIQCDETNHRYVVMLKLGDGGWFIEVYKSIRAAKGAITRKARRV